MLDIGHAVEHAVMQIDGKIATFLEFQVDDRIAGFFRLDLIHHDAQEVHEVLRGQSGNHLG
ncbi:hypothetical protein D3C80_2137220 [compost metagenome]